ncbi:MULTISPECIES: hypothetical protein [unclassified Pseudoalteromonas]|uniref:hypothetical protein n=1 Tax=unclassified Pseudoalteromonas TaxID=194690 RepID=UPI0025B5BFC4|nr:MULTISPECIES: hypothetical protein [unclassified Pseudoalteromonas]MDN3380366.1 hypothetical protein [Pseudoalteromonas sp. APC 3893]MDN3388699.1 hypothetical protein [Pseudoalteromonas sp. APC 4017]
MSKRMIQVTVLLIFIASLVIFKTATYVKQKNVSNHLVSQIKTRIALDLPRLDLSNTFLKHSGNDEAVKDYIESINNAIAPRSNMRLVAIGDVFFLHDDVAQYEHIERYLLTSDENIVVKFHLEQRFWQRNDVFILIILAGVAIGFGCWAKQINNSKSGENSKRKDAAILKDPDPLKLIIDLNTKTVVNSRNPGESVVLANKPLCFYLALIDFCIDNPDVLLNQNKDVPEELLEIANKYFYRLTELGHTIRKRPNFTNSLEKTLSEIRAALDEVLIEHPESKGVYYPPKAHGEGSRSRLHSYGLSQISSDDIEVVGK